MNKLSQCKIFSMTDERRGYIKSMTSIDYKKYYVSKDLYIGKIENIKAFKLPFATDVYNYAKAGRLQPAMFAEPVNPKDPDLYKNTMIPKSIFNMLSLGPDGKLMSIVDLSLKGRYVKTNTGEISFLDISDIAFFYLLLAGYINLRLNEDTTLTSNVQFLTLISEVYSVLLSKCIDRNYPLASNNVDFQKLFFLSGCFCLESMFELDKEKAMQLALKMKIITSKNEVMSESYYYNTDASFISSINRDLYPIDNFCNILTKEFDYIDANKFDSIILSIMYTRMFYESSVFALEHSGSFINMITLAKGRLKIFDDSKVERFMEFSRKDFMKDLAAIITKK